MSLSVSTAAGATLTKVEGTVLQAAEEWKPRFSYLLELHSAVIPFETVTEPPANQRPLRLFSVFSPCPLHIW